MGLGRKTLLAILTPLLSLLLFALAFNFGMVRAIGDAESVKEILSKSEIYSSVVPNILKQTGQFDTAVGEISGADQIVKKAATRSLPASEIQKYSEDAIDNIYAWLNGKTPQPTFNIDLSNSKVSFANNLASEVQQKLTSLPACTTAITATDFDVLNATCLPPGVSANSASDSLKNEVINNSDGFFNQASVKAADIKGNDPTKSVFQDQLKDAPAAFQWFKKSPTILLILTILAGAALVFLRPTIANGLKHLGAILLTVGLTMLIFAWIFNYVTSNRVSNISIENKSFQQSIKRTVGDLSKQVGDNYYVFGGAYSLLGLLSLATPYALSKYGRNQESTDEVVNEPAQVTDPKPKSTNKKS